MAPIKVFLTMVLALTLLAAPALAGGKDMMNPCQMNPCQKKDGHRMMMHKGYMNEMMDMMKETMGILKGLNHKPSPAQKKRLGAMMQRLDEMKASHQRMMDKMKGMMKDCNMMMEEGKMMDDGMMKKMHKMRRGDGDD